MSPAARQLFAHHLYEYRKGVRQMAMLTLGAEEAPQAAARLAGESIAHFIQTVNPRKVNLFFGRPAFVETARRLVTKPLNHLSPAEDFILGTLLGYDREQQCQRFLDQMERGGWAGLPPSGSEGRAAAA